MVGDRKRKSRSNWSQSSDCLCAWPTGPQWKTGPGSHPSWPKSSNELKRTASFGVAPAPGWAIPKSSAAPQCLSSPCCVWRMIWRNMAITSSRCRFWRCISSWPTPSRAPWRKRSPAPPSCAWRGWLGSAACARPMDSCGRRRPRNCSRSRRPSIPLRRHNDGITLGSHGIYCEYGYQGGNYGNDHYELWDGDDDDDDWLCYNTYKHICCHDFKLFFDLTENRSKQCMGGALLSGSEVLDCWLDLSCGVFTTSVIWIHPRSTIIDKSHHMSPLLSVGKQVFTIQPSPAAQELEQVRSKRAGRKGAEDLDPAWINIQVSGQNPWCIAARGGDSPTNMVEVCGSEAEMRLNWCEWVVRTDLGLFYIWNGYDL